MPLGDERDIPDDTREFRHWNKHEVLRLFLQQSSQVQLCGPNLIRQGKEFEYLPLNQTQVPDRLSFVIQA